MSWVLAIESSTANCAVSIQGDGVDYHYAESSPQQHAKLILPMIKQALNDTGIQPEQLTALAFGEGPGAFTGLRIAAGVIQGLAFGWQKPVVAISSLEALAYQGFEQTAQTQWLACLDARMSEIYCQQVAFTPQGYIDSVSTVRLAQVDYVEQALSQQWGIGDIEPAYPLLTAQAKQWIHAYPQAKAIACLALQRLDQAWSLADKLPQPIYLRPSVS